MTYIPARRQLCRWLSVLLTAALLTTMAVLPATSLTPAAADDGSGGSDAPAVTPVPAFDAGRAVQVGGWPEGAYLQGLGPNWSQEFTAYVYVPSEEYYDVPWWQLVTRGDRGAPGWGPAVLPELPVERTGLRVQRSPNATNLAGWVTNAFYTECRPLVAPVLLTQFDACRHNLMSVSGTGSTVTVPTTTTFRQIMNSDVPVVENGDGSRHAGMFLTVVPSGPTGLIYQADWEAMRTYLIFWVVGAPDPGTAPPSVTVHPEDARVAEGEVASFTSSATGSDSMQWQRSVNDGSTWTDVRGATGSTYSTAAVTPDDDGTLFRARFSNMGGSTYSDAARLTVTSLAEPPVVIDHPQSVSAGVGHPAGFSARADSELPLSVQWERLDPHGGDWAPVPGATSEELLLSQVTTGDDGAQFRAVFSNTAGSATTEAAVLTVWQAPNVRLVATPRVVLVDSLVRQ